MTHRGQKRTLGFVGSFSLGTGGLRLAEQPRVLDRDRRLIGEGLDHSTLVLGEGAHVEVEDSDRAEHLVAHHHRRAEHRAVASNGARGLAQALRHALAMHQIRKVCGLSAEQARTARSRSRKHAAHRVRHLARTGPPVDKAIVTERADCQVCTGQQPGDAGTDGIEDGLHVSHRSRNHAQHFRGGGLSLEGLLGTHLLHQHLPIRTGDGEQRERAQRRRQQQQSNQGVHPLSLDKACRKAHDQRHLQLVHDQDANEAQRTDGDERGDQAPLGGREQEELEDDDDQQEHEVVAADPEDDGIETDEGNGHGAEPGTGQDPSATLVEQGHERYAPKVQQVDRQKRPLDVHDGQCGVLHDEQAYDQ